MRLLLVSLALARWARAEDGDPTGNMCREYDQPVEGAWSVDEDCCAGDSQAACETGYHYVRSNEACNEECDAYYYSCEKCADDVECVGVGCENCDPHHDIYSDEHGGRPFNEEDVCRDNHGWIIISILFFLIWLGCCIASWTFGIIGLCNAPNLGTGQPLCCGCSPSNTYKANVCLSGGNFFMLCIYLIVVLGMWGHPDIGGIVTYAVLGGVTAFAAVQLKQKKEQWDVPVDAQSFGQPVQGQPVQGQPVMGTVITGQPVQGMPVQGMPVQPAMGDPVMVNGQPMKTI